MDVVVRTGCVSFNDTTHRCPVTGLLPVHIAVANGLRDVYDFITDGVPAEFRADPTLLSVNGRLASLDLFGCNPLQIAAKLGRKTIFKHVLRKNTSVMWKWGPVTQYLVDLQGIDSAGAGHADVMEIVAGIESGEEQSAFLLDE
jgi:hypothetical protein